MWQIKILCLWAKSEALQSTLASEDAVRGPTIFPKMCGYVRIPSSLLSSKQKKDVFFTSTVRIERKGSECFFDPLWHHAVLWQTVTLSVNKWHAIPHGMMMSQRPRNRALGSGRRRGRMVPSVWRGRNNRFLIACLVLCSHFCSYLLLNSL